MMTALLACLDSLLTSPGDMSGIGIVELTAIGDKLNQNEVLATLEEYRTRVESTAFLCILTSVITKLTFSNDIPSSSSQIQTATILLRVINLYCRPDGSNVDADMSNRLELWLNNVGKQGSSLCCTLVQLFQHSVDYWIRVYASVEKKNYEHTIFYRYLQELMETIRNISVVPFLSILKGNEQITLQDMISVIVKLLNSYKTPFDGDIGETISEQWSEYYRIKKLSYGLLFNLLTTQFIPPGIATDSEIKSVISDESLLEQCCQLMSKDVKHSVALVSAKEFDSQRFASINSFQQFHEMLRIIIASIGHLCCEYPNIELVSTTFRQSETFSDMIVIMLSYLALADKRIKATNNEEEKNIVHYTNKEMELNIFHSLGKSFGQIVYDNNQNKQYVCQHGLCVAIGMMLSNYFDNEDLCITMISVIHLLLVSSDNDNKDQHDSNAGHIAQAFSSSGTCEALVVALAKNMKSSQLVIVTMQSILSLCLNCDANVDKFGDCGGCEIITTVLNRYIKYYERNGIGCDFIIEGILNDNNASNTFNIRFHEIIQTTCATIYYLSLQEHVIRMVSDRNPHEIGNTNNKVRLLSSEIIPILIQVLIMFTDNDINGDNEEIIYHATGIFCCILAVVPRKRNTNSGSNNADNNIIIDKMTCHDLMALLVRLMDPHGNGREYQDKEGIQENIVVTLRYLSEINISNREYYEFESKGKPELQSINSDMIALLGEWNVAKILIDCIDHFSSNSVIVMNASMITINMTSSSWANKIRFQDVGAYSILSNVLEKHWTVKSTQKVDDPHGFVAKILRYAIMACHEEKASQVKAILLDLLAIILSVGFVGWIYHLSEKN